MKRVYLSSTAIVLLCLCSVTLARAYYCNIAALSGTPSPPNPVAVSGRIVSTDPVQITDGSGTLTVVGLTGDVSACFTVRGNYSGGVLTITDATSTVAYTNPPVSGEQRQFLLPGGGATSMCYIPAGNFLMGNNGSEGSSYSEELPQHSVYLSSYWIGKYEVTRGEYRAFMNAGGYANPSYWSTTGWNWKVINNRTQPAYWDAIQTWWGETFTQTDNHPVVGVNYYEAEAFCKWAGGRLPTEAEWERAARWTGSLASVYPWGDVWDVEKCNNYFDTNPAGGGYMKAQTSPVGSYTAGASPYGLQDMAGNVFEWCKDWFDSTYYSQTPTGGWVDPQGPSSGSSRVLRGGSWSHDSDYCRSAYRKSDGPGFWGIIYGFRLARSAP